MFRKINLKNEFLFFSTFISVCLCLWMIYYKKEYSTERPSLPDKVLYDRTILSMLVIMVPSMADILSDFWTWYKTKNKLHLAIGYKYRQTLSTVILFLNGILFSFSFFPSTQDLLNVSLAHIQMIFAYHNIFNYLSELDNNIYEQKTIKITVSLFPFATMLSSFSFYCLDSDRFLLEIVSSIFLIFSVFIFTFIMLPYLNITEYRWFFLKTYSSPRVLASGVNACQSAIFILIYGFTAIRILWSFQISVYIALTLLSLLVTLTSLYVFMIQGRITLDELRRCKVFHNIYIMSLK